MNSDQTMVKAPPRTARVARLPLREPFNGLSHLSGVVLGIAALVVLVSLARGKPWHLEPSRQGGDIGWPKGQILGTIRAYLEGTPVPGAGDTAGTVPPRAPEPLGTLVERLEGDARDFITAVDAAALVQMSAAELQRQLEAEPFSLKSQRPRIAATIGHPACI